MPEYWVIGGEYRDTAFEAFAEGKSEVRTVQAQAASLFGTVDKRDLEVRGRVFSDLNFRSNTSKPLSLFVRAGTRPEYVYGTSIESQVGVTWRQRENLGFELDVRHKDYACDTGHFSGQLDFSAL